MKQTWRSLKTKENGTCGIHATFGLCDSSGCELRHERPREHIRTLFAQSLDGIRRSVRLEHIGLVDAVASALWSDFVVPYVGCTYLHRPNEEDMFLGRLQNSPLWERVLQQVEQNRAVQQEIDAMKARSRSMSASARRTGCQES